jgi:hypothetical protein
MSMSTLFKYTMTPDEYTKYYELVKESLLLNRSRLFIKNDINNFTPLKI